MNKQRAITLAVRKRDPEWRKMFLRVAYVLCREDNIPEIAEKAGVSPSTLRNWVDLRVSAPHWRTLYNVADALGYTFTISKKGG